MSLLSHLVDTEIRRDGTEAAGARHQTKSEKIHSTQVGAGKFAHVNRDGERTVIQAVYPKRDSIT